MVHDDRQLPRLRSLDGARAFAVVLTTLVHLTPLVPGGIFGVDIFFVLSGFLITCILLNTYGATGTLDLKAFYLRRVRRLAPAVAALLLAFTVVVVLSHPTHRELLVAAVVDAAVVTNTFNWSDAFGHQPPWQVDHLWSLSLEEQFYLVWPLALLLLLPRVSRRTLLITTLVAALTSTLAQALAWAAGGSVAWAYLTSPLHAQGILMGCLLGQVYVWRHAEPALAWLSRTRWPAYAALAMILTASLTIGIDDSTTYYGGMAVVVLAGTVLVATAVAHDTIGSTGSWLTRALRSRVLVAIGRRSYSIYLWQNFLAWTLTPLRGTWLWLPVNIIATAVAAELSYRYIERSLLRPHPGHTRSTPSSVTGLPAAAPADGRGPAMSTWRPRQQLVPDSKKGSSATTPSRR